MVEGVPRQFIFNMDETGSSDYADRREITALVPARSTATSVPVPVDPHRLHRCRRVPNAAVRDRIAGLAYYAYDYHNVAIVSQENAFMTSSLFEIWADERRRDLGYQGNVVLLLDGLGLARIAVSMSSCSSPIPHHIRPPQAALLRTEVLAADQSPVE
jgi:hypothetical protein